MRESIGSAFLLYLVIFIVSAVMLLFVSILSYSKAYRIKNRIVEIIESNDGWVGSKTEDEIIAYLKESGYQINGNKSCPGTDLKSPEDTYKYCVQSFDYKNGSGDRKYYKVTTYSEIQFPIIGGIFGFKISGETKVLNN